MPAQRYRKRPNRLPGYDYSQPGTYFVTLCAHDRRAPFGDVVRGEMVPNEIGRMVLDEWDALPRVVPGIALDMAVLMPDRLHGIVFLGTDPDVERWPSLGDIIRDFKGRSTNRYLANARSGVWPPLDRRLWQQRYHDRIVRSDAELDRIRDYIAGNPGRWEERRNGTL